MRTKLQNMTEKSELKATLSARMSSVDTSRPIVESESEVLLNIAGPCSFGSLWILPSQMVAPTRPRTGGGDLSTGCQCHLVHRAHRHSAMNVLHLVTVIKLEQQNGQRITRKFRDLFRSDAPCAWELDDEDQSKNAKTDLTRSADKLETALPNIVAPSASSVDGSRCTRSPSSPRSPSRGGAIYSMLQ